MVICCGDNGIVEEGVTQTGQEVTGIVTQNFAKGETRLPDGKAGGCVAVLPIDLGVASELSGTEKDFPDLDHQIRIPGSENQSWHQEFSLRSCNGAKTGGTGP